MKYLLLLLVSSTCLATEYKFTFNIALDGKMNTLKYKVEAKNRSEALKLAGRFCGDFFGLSTRDFTENQTNAILDACTNPEFN